ncbi:MULTISPECIES: multidrug efflux SMR transporter [unclassified Leclercia]|jgi:paired small multidrug resistance pump|uniref:DMT family transporter n=1 Tax=unclassified Leclercia TaxID=2627398 RepID=UPI000DF349E8|nr:MULTISPECIES: SMR family transporter [unclassified Leclercia]AXF59204.1 LuxR family transcriptional regulator [Leclercia sp. W6]AXF64811.1 LuxR family transcriptional regulator [Leclercia sp. W17]MCG1030854.1 QacE family quaternary ammonium compound efflux SMR transporter [Bacillus amyloliquefaciens]
MISWLILFVAGCFEVAGISTLNGYANAGTARRKVTFLLATIVLFAIALSSLSISMREIPLSVAYAIFTGVGTIGAVAVGVLINGDKIRLLKGASIFLIIFSAIMLKLV